MSGSVVHSVRWGLVVTLVGCAILVACVGVGCGGAATTDVPTDTTMLAEGLGHVGLVGLTSTVAYFCETASGSTSVRSVPVAGGTASNVATGLGAPSSLAVIGTDCLYADAAEQAVYRGNADSTPAVMTRSTSGPIEWLASSGSALYWTTASGSNVMRLSLSSSSGGGDDPPGPISFPSTVASSDGITRVAASTSAAYFVDNGGTRINRVDTDGITDLATGLGTVTDLDVDGSTFAAVGANGIYVGGATHALDTPAVAVAVTGDSVFYATASALYLYSATGSRRMLTGTNITDIDANTSTILVADNPGAGGRLRTAAAPVVTN